MTKLEFIQQTHQHKSDIKILMALVAEEIIRRSEAHDNDKLVFADQLLDDQDALKAWIEFGFPKHATDSLHHKEHIVDVIGLIEMLVDWVAASYRRKGVLDPVATRLPRFDLDPILVSTLKLLVGYTSKL